MKMIFYLLLLNATFGLSNSNFNGSGFRIRQVLSLVFPLLLMSSCCSTLAKTLIEKLLVSKIVEDLRFTIVYFIHEYSLIIFVKNVRLGHLCIYQGHSGFSD